LREFILEEMKRSFGEHWWRQQVPLKIREECSKNKNEEIEHRSKQNLKIEDKHLIYYSNLKHLQEIIEQGDNWKRVFSLFFQDKALLQSRLTEINRIIRRPTAHNRNIFSKREINILEYFTSDILKSIREGRKTRTVF